MPAISVPQPRTTPRNLALQPVPRPRGADPRARAERVENGPTSLTFDSHTAAGVSYLFWWISGLVVYFNEHDDRFVRFHAAQSILFTSVLTVCGVFALMISQLLTDITTMTGIPIYATIGRWEGVLAWLVILGVWFAAMVAAWSGHYLRLPYIASYADRYSVPFTTTK